MKRQIKNSKLHVGLIFHALLSLYLFSILIISFEIYSFKGDELNDVSFMFQIKKKIV